MSFSGGNILINGFSSAASGTIAFEIYLTNAIFGTFDVVSLGSGSNPTLNQIEICANSALTLGTVSVLKFGSFSSIDKVEKNYLKGSKRVFWFKFQTSTTSFSNLNYYLNINVPTDFNIASLA